MWLSLIFPVQIPVMDSFTMETCSKSLWIILCFFLVSLKQVMFFSLLLFVLIRCKFICFFISFTVMEVSFSFLACKVYWHWWSNYLRGPCYSEPEKWNVRIYFTRDGKVLRILLLVMLIVLFWPCIMAFYELQDFSCPYGFYKSCRYWPHPNVVTGCWQKFWCWLGCINLFFFYLTILLLYSQLGLHWFIYCSWGKPFLWFLNVGTFDWWFWRCLTSSMLQEPLLFYWYYRDLVTSSEIKVIEVNVLPFVCSKLMALLGLKHWQKWMAIPFLCVPK